MGVHDVRICPCGSGLPSQWQFDGKGIPLTRTCPACHKKKMSGFNPVILKPYTQADVDEQIEEDL
jgi:hypothetical protein